MNENEQIERIALIAPRKPKNKDGGKSLGIEKLPTSITSLAGQMKRSGYDIRMFHSEANEKLFEELATFDPALVGISTMTPNFPEGMVIAQEIRKTHENAMIVLGGWHASGCVQAYQQDQEQESLREILNKNSPFDFVVSGEGDLVLPEIARKLTSSEESRKEIQNLPGVAFLANTETDEIRINTAQRIKDLDQLADPILEGLKIEEYTDKRSGKLDLSVHSHRACRFNCGFCSTSTVYGKGVTSFSPERTIQYIEKLLQEQAPSVITFTDEDFFADISWVERIVSILEETGLNKKYGVSFDTFASINDLVKIKRFGPKDLLKRMANVGFSSFTIGVESLNPKILKKYNKPPMIMAMMTPEQKEEYRQSSEENQNEMLTNFHFEFAQEAIDFAHENGILVVGDYMVGNPDESEKEVKVGFEKFSSLKNLFIAYIPTYTPFPGTKLWREAYESGLLARTESGEIDWAKFDASAGALNLGYDIENLRNRLEVEFYTSERYRTDMLNELSIHPELLALFKSRFNYIKNTFGENETVEERLRELE